MKSLRLYVLLSLLVACSQPKVSTISRVNSEDIIYILPFKVTELLKSQIDKMRTKDIYFCLHNYSDSFEIFISEINKKNINEYISNSNRKVFIQGVFYPLIFELDNIFATVASKNEILKEYNSSRTIKRVSKYIIHHGYSVKFDIDGNVIEEGNE